MTQHKDRKAKIRARMAADSISYTQATRLVDLETGQAPARIIDCVFGLAPLVGPDLFVPGVMLHEKRIEGFPNALQVETKVDQELGGRIRPRLASWIKFLKQPGTLRGGMSAR